MRFDSADFFGLDILKYSTSRVFLKIKIGSHMSYSFSQREKKTQRHYFCDQDQTMDIFAGARAEDSAIMMVANIRRARHCPCEVISKSAASSSLA